VAARLPEFSRERGSARRYINAVTGEALSYRQYRNLLSAADLVEPLDLATLANRRRKRTIYLDQVEQAIKAPRERILNAIERAEEVEDEEAIDEYKAALRTLKSNVMKSPDFKDARRQLVDKDIWDKLNNTEKRRVLKTLGRGSSIPDWVPVGESDGYRAGRIYQNKNGRVVHQRFGSVSEATRARRTGGFNTRGSK
jgi:hypothetical protein